MIVRSQVIVDVSILLILFVSGRLDYAFGFSLSTSKQLQPCLRIFSDKFHK